METSTFLYIDLMNKKYEEVFGEDLFIGFNANIHPTKRILHLKGNK